MSEGDRVIARSIRRGGYVLLAAGAVGAVGSLLVIAIALATGWDQLGAAVDAFWWSGITLCGAAALLFVSRFLGVHR